MIAGAVQAADELPILAWGSVPSKEVSVERFQELREAGFTHSLQSVSLATARQTLDLAQKTGIKLMLQAAELHTEVLAAFVQAVKEHPAFYAYFIQDEPHLSAFDKLGAITKRIVALDAQHPCVINWLGITCEPWEPFAGTKDYATYVDAFLKRIPVGVYSFDIYPVLVGGKAFDAPPYRIGTCVDEATAQPWAWPRIRSLRWYENLEFVAHLSNETGKPIWGFACSMAMHFEKRFDFPVAEPRFLRLQHYSNLAYGAALLQYFTYVNTGFLKPPHLSHAAPIENGKRTSVYERVREVNLELQARSRAFSGGKVKCVRHTGDPLPPATTRLAKSDLPAWVKTFDLGKDTALVSHITHPDGREYLLVLNRSFSREMTLRATFADGVTMLRKDGTEVPASRYNGEYWPEACEALLFAYKPSQGEEPKL